MLMPKKVKYRKRHKGKMRGTAYRGGTVSFGEYGLQALACGWITNRQIEAARVRPPMPMSLSLHLDNTLGRAHGAQEHQQMCG